MDERHEAATGSARPGVRTWPGGFEPVSSVRDAASPILRIGPERGGGGHGEVGCHQAARRRSAQVSIRASASSSGLTRRTWSTRSTPRVLEAPVRLAVRMGAEHRDPEAREVAPGIPVQRLDAPPRRRDLLRGDPHEAGDPAVPVLRDPLRRPRKLARDEDGRVRALHRLRIAPDGREVHVLPVELREAVAPACLHREDVLADVGPGGAASAPRGSRPPRAASPPRRRTRNARSRRGRGSRPPSRAPGARVPRQARSRRRGGCARSPPAAAARVTSGSMRWA